MLFNSKKANLIGQVDGLIFGVFFTYLNEKTGHFLGLFLKQIEENSDEQIAMNCEGILLKDKLTFRNFPNLYQNQNTFRSKEYVFDEPGTDFEQLNVVVAGYTSHRSPKRGSVPKKGVTIARQI